jgi:acyl carrier protein phosphodiesterase
MNFLAHLYLSGESEGLKTGNFIGDYVKGRKFEHYQGEIRQGILLHRAIDNFTDNNPYFQEAKQFFHPYYKRYSGIVADVAFDHFLAFNWNSYSVYTLRDYTRNAHAILLSNYLRLPFRVQQFLPVIIRNRRLESYATLEGFEKALAIMANYTSLPAMSHHAVMVVEENRENLQSLFTAFMKEVLQFVEEEHGIPVFRPLLQDLAEVRNRP